MINKVSTNPSWKNSFLLGDNRALYLFFHSPPFSYTTFLPSTLHLSIPYPFYFFPFPSTRIFPLRRSYIYVAFYSPLSSFLLIHTILKFLLFHFPSAFLLLLFIFTFPHFFSRPHFSLLPFCFSELSSSFSIFSFPSSPLFSFFTHSLSFFLYIFLLPLYSSSFLSSYSSFFSRPHFSLLPFLFSKSSSSFSTFSSLVSGRGRKKGQGGKERNNCSGVLAGKTVAPGTHPYLKLQVHTPHGTKLSPRSDGGPPSRPPSLPPSLHALPSSLPPLPL